MRAHPVNKLSQQTCYKSAAGLLQVVRFYVCIPGPVFFAGVVILFVLLSSWPEFIFSPGN